MAKLTINKLALQERKEVVRHKINDGSNVFRILPPIGEESNGYPYRRWVISWMFDPATGRKRPYASLRSFNESCPIDDYTTEVKQRIEDLSQQMSADGASKEEIKEKLKPITTLLQDLTPKPSFFYNAVSKDGKVGLLEIKKTAHDSLKKKMLEYIEKFDMDPTSVNSDKGDSGVWFNIIREGQMMSTKYSVELDRVATKDADGEIVERMNRSPLPANVISSYESSAHNLMTIYRKIEKEELKEVLLVNIADLASKFKVLRVKGFDTSSVMGLSIGEKPVEAEPTLVKTPKVEVIEESKPAPKKPMPKFDDEDDVPLVKPTPKPAPKAVKPPVDEDDLFAYADSLL